MFVCNQKSLLISMTLLAAVGFQVGCGSGANNQTPIHRTIPASGPSAKTGAKGQLPGQTPGIGTTSGAPGAGTGTTGKTDPNIDLADQQEQTLIKAGSTIAATDLTAGNYTLNDVVTYASITDMKTGDTGRAIQDSVPANSNGQWTLTDKNDKLSAGTLSNFADSGRKLDLPITFSVTLANGKWTPSRDQASNLTLSDLVTTPTGTPKQTDSFEASAANPSVSVMNLLASAPGGDGTYQVKDPSGVQVSLSVLKIDAQNIRMLVSFPEQTNTGSGTQYITFTRNIILTYTVAASTATDPNANANANQNANPPTTTTTTGSQTDDPITFKDAPPADSSQTQTSAPPEIAPQ